ncbi:MAG: beta-ketoacyl-[acyl-carrier-protein] synthase II, partial [Azovibrio restrictus]|nr:beta-ketoacyl-[acyl-carrier-protein] synthase II [Azovibrio restrictus]
LELTSTQPCRPYDAGRNGLSIGEGAAFALLERMENTAPGTPLLLGVGESSDAYHMSSPHPEGLGARLAMEAALKSAGLTTGDVDYINLHGTSTPANDAAEGRAVSGLFGAGTPCSSTKGATGHTLGAAGAVEAIVSILALQENLLPGSPGTHTPDPEIPLDYLLHSRPGRVRHVLSNSFGFGGSNCSLIFGLAPDVCSGVAP